METITANLNAWTLIVGMLMPLLVATVVSSNWSQRTRTIIGTLASIAGAVVTYGLTEGWDFDEGLFVAVAAILVLSTTAMETFWKNAGVYEWWRNATTLGSRSPSP